MQAREFALGVVSSRHLDRKLSAPAGPLSDEDPGAPLRLAQPARSEDLRIVSAHEARVPSIEGYHDPAQRRRILHALANHELQAAELYAWALLAFTDAPRAFRADLLDVLLEEQRHTRMYIARLEAHGGAFGEHPVSGYFWGKIPRIERPAQFVCAMALTFENANLDHTLESAAIVRAAGDEKTAAVIEQIHQDEISHVAFGWRWLEMFRDPGQSMWDAYLANVDPPLRPALARGKRFSVDPRVAAGLDADFIARLEASRSLDAIDTSTPCSD